MDAEADAQAPGEDVSEPESEAIEEPAEEPIAEEPVSAFVWELPETEAEVTEAEPPMEPEVVPAAVTIPGLPGGLPLIPVLGVDDGDMLSDLTPIEPEGDSVERALAAVAEAATEGLDHQSSLSTAVAPDEASQPTPEALEPANDVSDILEELSALGEL